MLGNYATNAAETLDQIKDIRCQHILQNSISVCLKSIHSLFQCLQERFEYEIHQGVQQCTPLSKKGEIFGFGLMMVGTKSDSVCKIASATSCQILSARIFPYIFELMNDLRASMNIIDLSPAPI